MLHVKRLIFAILLVLLPALAHSSDGWFLLTPPYGPGTLTYRIDLPLSQWNVSGAFDTAAACEDAAGRRYMKFEKNPAQKHQAEAWMNARCIPADWLKPQA